MMHLPSCSHTTSPCARVVRQAVDVSSAGIKLLRLKAVAGRWGRPGSRQFEKTIIMSMSFTFVGTIHIINGLKLRTVNDNYK